MNIYDALILKALGGGGGTTVVANPEGEATDELEKIQVGSDIYGIPKDYAELDNKPQINGETLSGNKTASELGLQAELDGAQTVEGNPITVTDAEPMNAESVVVELEPKQNLHGYDAPWVGGAGKNKFEVTATTQTINGITFTVNSDGTVIANGTATAEADFLMSVSNIQGSYIVNGCPIGGSASTYYLGVETTVSSWNNRDFGNGVTINDDTIIRVAIVIIGGYTANNLLFKPMIRLSTETDPTFAPYSNICPITGYSEVNVERVGKNLGQLSTSNIQSVNGHKNDAETYANNGVIVTSTGNYGRCGYQFSVNSGKTYTISMMVKKSANMNGGGILFGYTTNWDYEYGGFRDDAITTSLTKITKTFTAVNDMLYVGVYPNSNGVSVTIEDFMIEEGNQPTTYEPYQGDTYTIDLDGTKYGGTLDVGSGILTLTHGFITYSGSDVDLYSDDYENVRYARVVKAVDSLDMNKYTTNCITSMCRCADIQTGDFDNPENIWLLCGNIDTFKYWIALDKNITLQEAQNLIDGLQLVYELATPLTIQLTPTQIQMLENTNNISTDGTNITLKYQPNNVIGECKAYADEKCSEVLPPLPTTDGTYHLSCEVTSGVGELSWVSDS